MRKNRVKFPDLVCFFESKLIINENAFVIFYSIKETKSSLKDLLGKMFTLVLVKCLLSWE